MHQQEIDWPLEAAEAARDDALARVGAHAPAGWQAAALHWLEGFLRENATYFPDTDNQAGPQPPERRAWGNVTREARRRGWIVPTGDTRPRTCGHATPGVVYRSTKFGEEGGGRGEA